MKKQAFTMVEVLFVIIITGIIATFGLVTIIRSWDIACKYAYTKLYNALGTTMYNHMANSPIDADSHSSFPKTSEGLCKALISYMNTSDNKTEKNNDCSSDKSIRTNNPTMENFTDENVQIRLSNGAKIWIGAKEKDSKGIEYYTYKEPKGNYELNYYIIYADLNGDRKPNAISDTPTPDIVAFAVTDKYTVIPLGLPTVDRKYLTAYIVYTNASEGEENDEEGEYGTSETASEPMTYLEAKVQAFGTYNSDGLIDTNRIVTEESIHSYDFESLVFSEGSPFRISNPKDYFKTMPKFNKENCGNNLNLSDSDLHESLCSVKIYDFN